MGCNDVRGAANLLQMVSRLEVASTRRVLATNIEIADTFLARLRGLAGRSRLAEGGGMLFERARQIHTFGMRFPIDVVFCDRDWRVVHVSRSMRPWRLGRWVRGGFYVVELPAGAASDLDAGDRLLAV